jgi:hypothetical protein
MGLVVTGISQTPDIGGLEAALTAAGFSLEHIERIDPGDDTAPLAHGIITSPTGSGLKTGTGVPGLTTGNTSGGNATYFHDESLLERLGDFEIPDDAIDTYVTALGHGRSVVAFFAKAESIDAVEAIFTSAGLTNVLRF